MKLVAIDLDGTLLHDDCTISQYTKNIIEEASRNDIMVVPTSGRSFRNIKEQVKDIEGIKYCICSNGSIVGRLDTEEVLYDHKIPVETAYEIYKEIKRRGGFVQIYSDTNTFVENDVRHIIYDSKLPDEFCDNLLATDIPILSSELLLKRGLMQVNKLHVVFSDPSEMPDFADYCKSIEGIICTYPSNYNMEIFATGCNKDKGIRIICEKCGIEQQDTIAIGDSDNDVAMIQYANIGIAVDNAMDVLKEVADYITKSNNEDGPAIVLEKILKK